MPAPDPSPPPMEFASLSPLPPFSPLSLLLTDSFLSFLMLLILFFFQLLFLLLPSHVPIFLVSGGVWAWLLLAGIYNIRLFIILFEPCVLLVFQLHTGLPLNLLWLFLLLSCPWIFKFIVALVQRGFWLRSCQLLKFNCTF